MNVKQLKEELSKFPDDKEVYVANHAFEVFMFPITTVDEGWTADKDEPSVVILNS